MVKVEEQDALGLRQLSLKLISIRVITKYGKLHYSTLIRVVESCTMVLIQHFLIHSCNMVGMVDMERIMVAICWSIPREK